MKRKIIISLLVLLILTVFTGNVFAYTQSYSLMLPIHKYSVYTSYQEKVINYADVYSDFGFIGGNYSKALVRVVNSDGLYVSDEIIQTQYTTRYIANEAPAHDNVRLKLRNSVYLEFPISIEGEWNPH